MILFRLFKWRVFGLVLLLIASSIIYGGFSWWRSCSANQFTVAIERHDFGRAEQLWKRGIRTPASNPYGQFMRVKDRLRAVSGIQVTEWSVGKLQTINGCNRYFALLDVQDSAKGSHFGIGLEWQREKWVLKTDNPDVPPYLRNILAGDALLRTAAEKTNSDIRGFSR